MTRRVASRRNDCGKTRYRDREEAKDAIRTIKLSGEVRDKRPVRAYECPDCRGWHLTSKAS